jgi:uncharacterized protein (TIGR03089 family)
MPPAGTPEQLFADALARDPGRPLVTYYDGTTGERSELSLKSLANWVAKTHHLLIDQVGLDVGALAFVDLPAHWLSVVPLLGCLTAGLSIDTVAAGADVAFVTEQSAHRAVGVPDAFAIATASAAVGFRGAPPAGTEDFVAAVRPQQDTWSSVHFPAGPDVPALGGRTRVDLTAEASARAAELGLAAGARVLSTRDWREPQDWIDTLLAPLAAGGSVVYLRNVDAAAVDRVADQERVTNRL